MYCHLFGCVFSFYVSCDCRVIFKNITTVERNGKNADYKKFIEGLCTHTHTQTDIQTVVRDLTVILL